MPSQRLKSDWRFQLLLDSTDCCVSELARGNVNSCEENTDTVSELDIPQATATGADADVDAGLGNDSTSVCAKKTIGKTQ